MLSWMETATLHAGTAHRAAIDGVRISAKTGTAQVASSRTGTYSDSDFIASMIGIVPTEEPQLIVYVVVENPRGQSYYGSQIAAPIFRDITVSLMDKMGIPRAGMLGAAAPQRSADSAPRQAAGTAPAEKYAPSSPQFPQPSPPPRSPQGPPTPQTTQEPGPSSTAKSAASAMQAGSAMPDLRGMPKKLLLPLLLRKDLEVTINGSGYVVSQDPPPGTLIQDGMKIDLELR
jgi:cell division protein FtsI (penicillin-binding protein 3)